MFFEGSEKKVEIVVSSDVNLRRMPEGFWDQMVAFAGAKILSKISNEEMDAYLLSESSLFVWDDYLTMITCGRTTLAKATSFFLDRVSKDKLKVLIYERKNEYFPHLQETHFFHDVKHLKNKVLGSSYRFGCPDEHHLLLFSLDKEYAPGDSTTEVLMYNLQGRAKEILNAPEQSLEQVRDLIRVDEIFKGFKVDDHLFSPRGYSLNAIRGKEYYTMHVTPEETGSYVSFETNVDMIDDFQTYIRQLLEVFQPQSFDLVCFRSDQRMHEETFAPYVARNYFQQDLACGYQVGFTTYFLRSEKPQPALLIEGI